ncbi:GNAT family N-acetyltransferase [archaeon]|nr:MAG: GNAT family N-acetyltransferase [archaeon]
MAVIRTAKLEDVPTIAKMYIECRIDDGYFTEPVLREQYTKHPTSFLIADENGKAVGTLYYQADGMAGSVWKLGVLPSYRRRGIATALMNEAESRIKDAGCLAMVVLSKKEEDAISLYESLNMEKSDTQPMIRLFK